jgi:hypothetical protein
MRVLTDSPLVSKKFTTQYIKTSSFIWPSSKIFHSDQVIFITKLYRVSLRLKTSSIQFKQKVLENDLEKWGI